MSAFLFACEAKPQPVLFPVQGTHQILYGLSKAAVEGKFNFSSKKKLEYRFAAPVAVPHPASFEIEYSLTGTARPVLELDGRSWLLPNDADWSDTGDGASGGIIFRYAIPIGDPFPDYFNITSQDNGGRATTGRVTSGSIQISSVTFNERWYGIRQVWSDDSVYVDATPFVSSRGSSWVIDPPSGDIPTDLFPVLSIGPRPWIDSRNAQAVSIEAGSRHFEVLSYVYGEWLRIPAGMMTLNDKPLVIPSQNQAVFSLSYDRMPSFPEPIIADPGLVIAWPHERWRDKRYEVFKWDRFPTLLIFDFVDYDMQDRMLKRLAFFVEKAGFRGRLAPDSEIEELHAWNAHDYRAHDLARFFQLAREKKFPLLAEERELERILLNAGVIQESGVGLQAGEGGMISISRESADYLRYRFMAHEGFHGIFFIDEDFRNFSRDRWRQLPAEAKRFLVSFFGFQQYDTADEYLMINEFMGHVLQQSVSQAANYFGQNLPSRLEDGWRKAHLPKKDEASNSWPSLASAFLREAEAFSAYVNHRWGLAAGRVHLVTVRQQ